MTKEEQLRDLEEKIARVSGEGKIAEAAAYLGEAVALAKETDGVGSNRHIELQSEYGGLLKYIGRAEEAVVQLTEVKEILKQRDDRKNYATALVNLAGAYRFCQDYQNSEALYLEARKLLEDQEYVYASICNNLGILYQDEGRLEEAESMHLESLEILRGKPDYEEEFVTTLGNLASVCLSLKRYEDAGKLLQEAESLLETVGGKGHSLQASILNQKAILLYYMKEYEEALDATQKAYEICRETLGETSEACRKLSGTMQAIQSRLKSEREGKD